MVEGGEIGFRMVRVEAGAALGSGGLFIAVGEIGQS